MRKSGHHFTVKIVCQLEELQGNNNKSKRVEIEMTF